MKIVRIFGGLGNQMFQYALYKSLEHKFNNVKIDTSDFHYHNHHNGYEIDKIFDTTYNIADKEEIKKITYPRNLLIYKIFDKILKKNLNKGYDICEGKDRRYNKEILNIRNTIYYDGYWQSELYFKDIEKLIRKEFTFKNELDERNLEIAQKIKNTNSVSIHVRRGDYIGNKSLGNICGKEYYLKSVEYIEKNIEKPEFFIFSDDIEWAKDSLNINYPKTYISWNKNQESYKDMQLMSYCKHNIIANSTFSWWGAWLNNNTEKIVIAPKLWFADKKENDIIPEAWIKI